MKSHVSDEKAVKGRHKRQLEECKHNADLLRDLVLGVNCWDGSLDRYEAYDFEDYFFDTYFEGRPSEAARAVCFGDIRNWMDEYIRFDGYGNLESLSGYSYAKELQDGADEIIDRALELSDHIELAEVLERYT